MNEFTTTFEKRHVIWEQLDDMMQLYANMEYKRCIGRLTDVQGRPPRQESCDLLWHGILLSCWDIQRSN